MTDSIQTFFELSINYPGLMGLMGLMGLATSPAAAYLLYIFQITVICCLRSRA